jgi:hypothetical protein
VANSLQPPPYDINSDTALQANQQFVYNTFFDSDDASSRNQRPRKPVHLLIGVIISLGWFGFLFWTYKQAEWHSHWPPGSV